MRQVLMLLQLLRLSCVGEAIGRYGLVNSYIKLMSINGTFTSSKTAERQVCNYYLKIQN